MAQAPRVLRVLGEGALAGLLSAAVLGGWDIRLNQDLPGGLVWLATLRLAGAMPQAIASGLLLSVSCAALTLVLRRPARQRLGTLVAALRAGFLGLAAAAGVAAAIAPIRHRVIALSGFSSARLSAAAVTALAAVNVLLFVMRFTDPPAEAGPRPDPGGRRLRSLMGVAGLASLGLAAAFVLAAPLIGSARSGGHPSVIVVSIDTLRADRTGFLGSERRLTPRLDALASEGLVFENASSAAPWTLPAHVSLFTSRLPFDHHVRWSWMRIHPEHSMLAERFRDAGYRTAAFTGGAYVASTYGFAQGFELYEDHDELAEGGAQGIVSGALRWLEGVRREPFFLFVHTYEPHTPYNHAALARPEDAGRLPRQLPTTLVTSLQSGDLILTDSERRYVTDLYDGDVQAADEAIGGLLMTLRERGILDQAILVLVSDHGEDLWDHDLTRSPGHGHSLYEELIHIPLFVRAPGRLAPGRRIRTPVSLLDVAPTLLDLAGLPPDPRHEGRSLARACRTGEEPEPRPILAESVEYGPDRFSRREGALKVILTPTPEIQHHELHLKVEPLEVFDLAADPAERQDLSDRPQEPTRRMVREVKVRADACLLGSARGTGPGTDLPEDVKRQLRSLGYIQ